MLEAMLEKLTTKNNHTLQEVVRARNVLGLPPYSVPSIPVHPPDLSPSVNPLPQLRVAPGTEGSTAARHAAAGTTPQHTLPKQFGMHIDAVHAMHPSMMLPGQLGVATGGIVLGGMMGMPGAV